eukprot:6434-Pelagococcus_subviridis.AAC.2
MVRREVHDHLVQDLGLPSRVQAHARGVVHDDERKDEAQREERRVQRFFQPDRGREADDERRVRRRHASGADDARPVELAGRVPGVGVGVGGGGEGEGGRS